jgi:hypothetical protein
MECEEDSRRCADHAETFSDLQRNMSVLTRAYLTEAAYFREESKDRGQTTIEGLKEGSSERSAWEFLKERFDSRSWHNLVANEENSSLFGKLNTLPDRRGLKEAKDLCKTVQERDLHAGDNQDIIDMYRSIVDEYGGNTFPRVTSVLFQTIHEKCRGKETPAFVDELIDLIRTHSPNHPMANIELWMGFAVDAVYQGKPIPIFPDRIQIFDKMDAITFVLFAIREQALSESGMQSFLPALFTLDRFRSHYDIHFTLLMDNLFTVLALEHDKVKA